MEVTTILNTDGRGLWSQVARPVVVNYISLSISTMEEEDDTNKLFGELCVYFDTASWDPDKDGLIYTDKLFVKELHNFLKTQGFSEKALETVYYSEQGMQGDDYVSLDADDLFCKEWLSKYPDTEVFEY
jgi:hypothetical protein